MSGARQRLQAPTVKELYTAKDVPGLGKNYMLEGSRKKAVETYTFYVRYYALLGLNRELQALTSSGRVDGVQNFLKTKSSNPRWEHERNLLEREFPKADVISLLKELIRMQEKIAQDVQSSKEKDDHRGAEVIEDYSQAHKPASQDSFVKETWNLTNQMKAQVDQLISRLQKNVSR